MKDVGRKFQSAAIMIAVGFVGFYLIAFLWHNLAMVAVLLKDDAWGRIAVKVLVATLVTAALCGLQIWVMKKLMRLGKSILGLIRRQTAA